MIAWADVRREERATALLRTRALRWIGKRSYAVYLVHHPMALTFRQLSTFPRLVAVMFTTLTLAGLSWRLVEVPFLRLRPRIFGLRVRGSVVPVVGVGLRAQIAETA